MVNLLFTVIVALIIMGVLYWAVTKLSAAFGFPPPVVTILQVVIVVIIVLWLLSLVWPGHLMLR
jgi:hypothetical protein